MPPCAVCIEKPAPRQDACVWSRLLVMVDVRYGVAHARYDVAHPCATH